MVFDQGVIFEISCGFRGCGGSRRFIEMLELQYFQRGWFSKCHLVVFDVLVVSVVLLVPV